MATNGRRTVRQAWLVLGVTAATTVLCALVASGTWAKLQSGGFEASGTESVRAEAYVAHHFKNGSAHLVLLARASRPVDDPAVVKAGTALVEQLRADPGVVSVRSYWGSRDPAMRSVRGNAALVTAVLDGPDAKRTVTARELVPRVTGVRGVLRVGATGTAWTAAQSTDGSERDLLRAELLTAPLVFLVLVYAFRSLVAALLPIIVAAVTTVITLALLRPLASVTELSVFSVNLTTALGFGLAVDYCLFLFTRYRLETAKGLASPQALRVCMRTAGRAIAYSVATITLAMSALLFFPVAFLRSMGCAGVVVTACAGMVSLVLLPALVTVLGPWLELWDLTPGLLGAKPREERWQTSAGWRRVARIVCEKPVLWGIGALAILCLLAYPVTHMTFGPIDERTLPRAAEPHAVASEMRTHFPSAARSVVVVALPDVSTGVDEVALTAYAKRLSSVPTVRSVTAATGTFVSGRRDGPGEAESADRTGAWLSVILRAAAPESEAAAQAVRAIRATPAPYTSDVGGDAARFLDTKASLRSAAVPAAALIGVTTIVVLFLFTGSLFIPVKAVAVGTLSIGACFGAVVLVFQDGHGAQLLGVSTVSGTVDACVMLLVFCVAFGLSMDYEVFLLSRIQEEYQLTGNNRLAVERGIEHTGRMVTVAALVVAIALAALVSSGITPLKLLGFGLSLAVIVDATLVRAVLVPAAMCVADRVNWWAPGPLRRVHRKARSLGEPCHGPREQEELLAPGRV